MIAVSQNSIPQDDAAKERFVRAYAWLASTDLASLEPGRHDIDGDDIFANVMAITTVPAAEKSYEAHHAYADIHIVIEGEERIGVAPVEDCTALQDFDEEADFCLYSYPDGEASWVVLRKGDLCVTPPADAHKPACSGPAGPAPLRKACVKVRI